MNRLLLLFEVLLLTVGIAFNGHAQTDAAIPEAPRWEVLLQQANDLFNQWKEQEAIELCQQVLQSDAPLAAKAEAHGVLAEIYLSLGQFDAAIAEARAALGMEGILEEDRAELLARIEEIRQTRAEFGRRISSYRAILGSRPAPEEAARVRYELAFTYLVHGWREEAKREVEGLIGAFPASEWASKAAGLMAVSCAVVGDAEQAEQYYDQAVRSYIAQGNPMKAVRLIQSRHRRKKDPEGAIAALKKLISTHPGTEKAAAALLGVGEIHKRYRRLNLTRRAYERVVAEYPGSPAAIEGQGYIVQRHFADGVAAYTKGNYETAIREMREVLKNPIGRVDGERDLVFAVVDQSYKALGRHSEAADCFRGFMRDFPEHPWVPLAKLFTGDVYAQMGRYGEAIREYEELLAQYPQAPEAKPARQLIEYFRPMLEHSH